MSWTQSLIKLSGYEVETLQKRLREVADRQAELVAARAAVDTQEASEAARARADASSAWCLAGFRKACDARRAKLGADLAGLELEAQGVRDALGQAFETQKKYEHVAAAAAVTLARAAARIEAAALDEVGLRRRTAA